MTLLDIIPSLRSGWSSRLDPAVWPRNTHYDGDGRITLGGVALAEIADQYGTATYVLDEDEVRTRCWAYRRASPEAEISYPGKALMIQAIAEWVSQEGLCVDVCSAGELAIALAAGVDPARIILHGNEKSAHELETSLRCDVGAIVIDSLTGVIDQNFGLPLGIELAAEAVERLLRQPNLSLVGFHCHLGSQIYDPDHYGEAVRRMVGEMAQIHRDHGRILTELDLGGGHAVAYHSGHTEMNLAELADIIEDALDAACARHHFPARALPWNPVGPSWRMRE